MTLLFAIIKWKEAKRQKIIDKFVRIILFNILKIQKVSHSRQERHCKFQCIPLFDFTYFFQNSDCKFLIVCVLEFQSHFIIRQISIIIATFIFIPNLSFLNLLDPTINNSCRHIITIELFSIGCPLGLRSHY